MPKLFRPQRWIGSLHIPSDYASAATAKSPKSPAPYPSSHTDANLNRLRAFRRKAKAKRGSPDSSNTSLSVPASPTPSKRSKSGVSERSSSEAASRQFLNMTSETQSAPVAQTEAPSVGASPESGEEIPFPGFLRQSKPDLHAKWLDLEWEQRHRIREAWITTDTPSQWARLTGEEVQRRNRYQNVEAYATNRIRLKVPEGHSDYINASPIVLETTKKKTKLSYIATQGPKEDSSAHMWRMVWDETGDPAIIVMLTQTHESGREKCFPYFPMTLEEPSLVVNENDEFGDQRIWTLTLKNLIQDPATRSTIRELDMARKDDESGDRKKVLHFLFEAWLDFLVPEGDDRNALINLIQITRSKSEDTQSPRIVHCSAGVGRSGTFIALDWLLTELAEGALDDLSPELDESGAPKDRDPILEVVENMRTQRMMMVQSEAQFYFLYDVARELWAKRWKERAGVVSSS